MKIEERLAPESLGVASARKHLGNVAYLRGDLDRAVRSYNEALEIEKKLAPGGLGEAASRYNLGNIAYVRGDLATAAEYYSDVLRTRKRLEPDSPGVADCLDGLGLVARARGDLARAADCYARALQIKEKYAPGGVDVAASFDSLAILARERGEIDRAADYHRRALEIRERLTPESLDVAASLVNLGSLTYLRGDLDGAAEYYSRGMTIEVRHAPGSLPVAICLNGLGIVARARGDLDRAADYHARALEMEERLTPRSLEVASTLHYLGLLDRDRGDSGRATDYLTRALGIREKLVPKSSAEAETLYELARLSRERHDLQAATSLLDRALASVAGQVGKLGGSHDVKAGFRARHDSYYREQIEVQLELDRAAEAFHTLERSRAQSFLAQLAERDLVFFDIPEELVQARRRLAVQYERKQQEIADTDLEADSEGLVAELRRLREEYDGVQEQIRRASPKLASLQDPSPLDLEAAQEALDPGTVMLSYSVGKEVSHVFVVSKGESFHVHSIEIGEKALEEHLQAFQGQLHGQGWQTRGTSRVELAKFLYKTLLEPAEDDIAASERLLILPDGPLHRLPLAALIRPTEADGDRPWRYLVEWKPLHTALSATVNAELKKLRRKGGAAEVGQQAVAAFGDPQYPQKLHELPLDADGEPLQLTSADGDVYVRAAAERGYSFRPLPATRDEVKEIARLYPRATTYLGNQVTEERAKSLGKDIRIVHFAAHGLIDDRFPLDSALALTIPEHPAEGQENGLLQAWEIFERVRLDADLVVLSACESAGRATLDGEGLIGLSRAFQFAGARSVLASLWQVADPTTAALMQRFYRYLRGGKTKDEALRAAQLELIREPIEVRLPDGGTESIDASAPYYWAAFQLYGDWL